MNICVYCSSSDKVDPAYVESTRLLAKGIAERGDTLVYGGGTPGLMGVLARTTHDYGGRVVGVIPEKLNDIAGITYTDADELVIMPDMSSRKAEMIRRADAFVALPGGFGTLEELFEVLTLKQLKYLHNPIALVNIRGYYDQLNQVLEHLYTEQFAKINNRNLYHIAQDVPAVFTFLDNYQPIEIDTKWYDVS